MRDPAEDLHELAHVIAWLAIPVTLVDAYVMWITGFIGMARFFLGWAGLTVLLMLMSRAAWWMLLRRNRE